MTVIVLEDWELKLIKTALSNVKDKEVDKLKKKLTKKEYTYTKGKEL